jgi:o-succinylbenzoate---CoA ligase
VTGLTHDPVRFWAAVRPDRTALRSAHSSWTYGDLDRAVWATADALLERGLGSGEHIALEFAPEDAVAFAIAFHAVQRIGSLPVLVGAHGTEAERRAMRERAQVDFTLNAGDLDIPMLDTEEASASEGNGAAGSVETAPPSGGSAARSAPPTEATGTAVSASELRSDEDLFLERRLDAPAAVLFTSGTSGDPRAAILTHGNFLWSALASARNLSVREDDLWLACMPLHHVGGVSILVRAAMAGAAALLHDGFDPEAVNEAIDARGVTLVSFVPTMLARLLETRRGRRFPATLRAALIGGGPAQPDLLEEAARLGMRALPTYGMTETASQATTLPLREWPRGLETAGRPLPFTQVEIRGEDDRPLGPGAEGEIVVRGPTVMAGYLGDPDATAAALQRRWLRTGDVGLWDPEGRLVVLDRRADRVVTGGENVSPEEVERVLAAHPAVREHARGALSGFKIPRRFLILKALPRSAGGKLLRRVVRERFLDEMAKQKHP